MKTLLTLLLFTGIAHAAFSQTKPIYFHATKSSFKLHEKDKLSPPIDCNDIFILNGTQKEILVLSETGRVYTIIDQQHQQAADGELLLLTAKDRNNNIVHFFLASINKGGGKFDHTLAMINEDKSGFYYEGVARDVF
ncbi:MAG TPA: hypothetical protein VGM41_12150 [Chitinophagaceae bacterium]|jgi:hypothetical protein